MNTKKICAGLGALALIGGLAACGRTAKAASPIRQMRPNAIRDTSMS